MKIKPIAKISCVLLFSLLISSCGANQLLSRTLTPTPSINITPTPPPFAATFDDNLCEIKGSFILDGELCFANGVCGEKAIEQEVEGSPSYELSLFGNSTDGNSHYLTIWVKHSLSPGPNEMQTLPEQFKNNDINIYTSDNDVLHANLEPVRLKLHVISAKIAEPSDDPLVYCDYVVEEIQQQ